MPNSTTLTKENIIHELQNGFDQVVITTQRADDVIFFAKPNTKWSVANNVEHLILSVKPLSLAFRLPMFSLRLFGSPKRPMRTYDELVEKYMAKLAAGGTSSSAFLPRSNYKDKNSLIADFKNENLKLIKSLSKWKEADLDRYLLPHPLLGKLYAREMLYFTIYHTQHHLQAIEKLL